MPSYTLANGLIKLYHAVPGAPWIYPTWQDVTGVRHGLFPTDDDKLPHGWTREIAKEVEIYFSQYSRKNERQRQAFAGKKLKKGEKDSVAGRTLFGNWVSSQYGTWKVHALVIKVLNERHLHLIQIMASNDCLSEFPLSGTYLPMAIDDLAEALFGLESLDASGLLLNRLRGGTLILLQRTWENCRKQTKRSKQRLENCEKKALEAFDCEQLHSSNYLFILTCL